ncbi:MAG: glycosyltransferase family 2 protein [Clostridia bacterium]|nr:glycosyltransferase family 2 protein [Clostridia bacterium]
MGEICAEILLAAYNGERYIREQIDSILAQEDKRWHLTVSDDGSIDSTSSIIDEYVCEYPGKITRFRSEKHFGNARDHFFQLIKSCKSHYMIFCDQDDVWYKDKAERVIDALIETENRYGSDTPILVFSDQTVTDEHLKPIAPSLMRYQKQYFEHFDYRSILMQNVVTGGAMMINRALADLAMRCADTSQVIMHDWWMAAVAARFGRIVYIDESLGAYRQHGDNSVGAKDVGSSAYVRRMMSSLGSVRAGLLCKKRQAQVFAETYSALLDEKDRIFLQGFSRGRSGPWFYLKNRELIHGGFRLMGMMTLG